jgi:hypothetical protein
MSLNAGGGGGSGVSSNEYSCAHGAKKKLWRSNSIFNIWGESLGWVVSAPARHKI